MKISCYLAVPLVTTIMALTGSARADFDSGLEAYTSGSFEMAAREWAPLAEKGDAAAQYHLGLLHDEGQGVARDLDLARYWYLRAAQQGFVDAFFILGEMYAVGRGTHADRSLAYHWYTMAAASGHARAKEIMGRYAPKLSTEQLAEAGRITTAWRQAHTR
jgi:uncharacterized protein